MNVDRELARKIHFQIIEHLKNNRIQPKESITGCCLALVTAALTGELSEEDFKTLLVIELQMYQKALLLKNGAMIGRYYYENLISEVVESLQPREYPLLKR